ncbi:MAG TPA: CBS domain-containing protein [Solirubrobacteraceae bacterium]|nr:CBS domain-containing protein [Solirubrobacteraceae bacterium]
MAQSIREVMTADPRTVETGATVVEAARAMAQDDIGAVLVTDNGRVTGIVTDRDIVVRSIAEGRDPSSTKVTEVCTADPATLTVDQSVEDAIRIVREQDVRRIPVVQDGRPAGIVSIGDLAIERDATSALADISSEPANN